MVSTATITQAALYIWNLFHFLSGFLSCHIKSSSPITSRISFLLLSLLAPSLFVVVSFLHSQLHAFFVLPPTPGRAGACLFCRISPYPPSTLSLPLDASSGGCVCVGGGCAFFCCCLFSSPSPRCACSVVGPVCTCRKRTALALVFTNFLCEKERAN